MEFTQQVQSFLVRIIPVALLPTIALVFSGVGASHSLGASYGRVGQNTAEVHASQARKGSSEQNAKTDNSDQCGQAAAMVSKAEQLRGEWKRPALEEAITNYTDAQVCWHKLAALDEEAKAWKGIADIHFLLSEFESAKVAYSKALAIRKALPDRAAEAEATSDMALNLDLLGQTKEGLERAEEALVLSRRSEDRTREAQALYALGISSYLNGDVARALDSQTKALQLAQETNSRELVAKVLLGIGYVHNDLDDLEDALRFYNQALAEWKSLGNRWGEAKTLTSLGLVYILLGDRQKALDALTPTLSIMQQIGDRLSEAATLNNLAYLYQTLGDLETALQYYRDAMRVYEGTGFLVGRILALEYCGDIYALLARNEDSLRSYQEAVDLCRDHKNHLMEADALNGLAAAHLALGLREQARGILRGALTKYKARNNWRAQSATLNHLGYYFELGGQVQKASEYYTQALSFAESAQDNEGTAATHYNIARISLQSNDLENARRHVEQCLAINETSRAKLASHNMRGSYLASVHQHYEFYVDVLMRLHKAHPAEGFNALALQASEKARSRSLLELLSEAGADIRQGVSLALLDRERSAHRALNAAAERRMHLPANSNPPESDALNQEIQRLTREFEEVEAEIRASSPRYAALTRPEPLNLNEIQQNVLDENSELLEFALGDERSYLWAITRTEVSSYELPGRAEIEGAARKVYALLTASQPIAGESFEQREARITKANQDLPAEIADLSRLTIGPVASELATRRLLIVSDGALQRIPFQILTTNSRSNGSDYARPLVLDHQILNEPSASTLELLIKETARRKEAPNTVAVFADPVFEADDPRIKLAKAKNDAVSQLQEADSQRALRDIGVTGEAGHIPRLQASRAEADAIMSVTPWRAGFEATGFQASRATVMKPEIGNYRIVHFATHGLLNDEHPELSGVVLSLFDEKGEPQDGFLRLHDIYNLKLPADLVVLSACNSGLGKDVKGEGLVGLTRGFMYAGASSVVASLWKVDDEATAELMRYFYGFMLKDGLSPAAALRKAQVTMSQQKRWQSPYYWSGFIIQGQYIQREPMNHWRRTQVALLGGVAALLILAAFFVIKRRRRTIL